MQVAMERISTIKQLISAWPRRQALADDLGVNLARVHKWAQSGSIPAEFQLRVIDAATARGIAITAEEMLRFHMKAENSVGCDAREKRGVA